MSTEAQPAMELVPQQRAVTQAAVEPQQGAITPAHLLRMAVERNDGDIDRLERLMAMDERYREQQERERQREAVLAFRRDFAALRGENIVIPKTRHVDRGRGGSFWQAEYDQVMARLSPALAKHGFGIRHDQKFGLKKIEGADGAEPWVWVTCFLEHRDGHSERLDLEGPPGDQTVNSPVQNMQVTASYLKRQSVLAITGTATAGEDSESGMRGKQHGSTGKPEDAPADDALVDAGEEKSTQGVAALTAWWGSLSTKDRNTLSSRFGAWKKAAAQFDQDQKGQQ